MILQIPVRDSLAVAVDVHMPRLMEIMLPHKVTVCQTAAGRPPSPLRLSKVAVLRLESLVKRLQAELAAERDYTRSMEEAVKTLKAV